MGKDKFISTLKLANLLSDEKGGNDALVNKDTLDQTIDRLNVNPKLNDVIDVTGETTKKVDISGGKINIDADENIILTAENKIKLDQSTFVDNASINNSIDIQAKWTKLEQHTGNIILDGLDNASIFINSDNNIKLKAQDDIDLNSENNINLNSQKDIRINAAKDNIIINSHKNLNIYTSDNIDLNSQKDINLNSQKDINLNSQKDINLNSQKDINLNSQKDIIINAENLNINTSDNIDLNSEKDIRITSTAVNDNASNAGDVFIESKKDIRITSTAVNDNASNAGDIFMNSQGGIYVEAENNIKLDQSTFVDNASINNYIDIQDKWTKFEQHTGDIILDALDNANVFINSNNNINLNSEKDTRITSTSGNFIVELPKTDPMIEHALWNSNGTVKISSGK